MPQGRQRVTLDDVARLSGVSVSTASRVLNGRGRVSEATRERVRNAAERLDFVPNALAKQFASGWSNMVAILTLEAPAPFAMSVITGALRALGEADVGTQLCDPSHGERSLWQTLRMIDARRMDGVIVVGRGTREPIASITQELSVPVVYAFGRSSDDRDVSVIPDGRMAGRVAAEHLVSLGRRRIAHITARDDLSADLRIEGLRSGLADHDLTMVGEPFRGEWTRSWGSEATNALLASGMSFDGIFCGNDEIAVGAYSALSAADRDVPGDVALLGVDNLSRFLGIDGEHIGTIDTRLTDLGAAAATNLLEMIHHGDIPPGVHFQPCELVLDELPHHSA